MEVTSFKDGFVGFFSVYGTGLAMLILAGFCIAMFTELAIKKVFVWLEQKFADKEKLLNGVSIAKMIAIPVVTIFMTLVSTKLIMDSIVLPGSVCGTNALGLSPFWFMVIYVCQYVFSMYGIKGIIGLFNRRHPHASKHEKAVSPVDGYKRISKNCYKDEATGKFYDRKGNEL